MKKFKDMFNTIKINGIPIKVSEKEYKTPEQMKEEQEKIRFLMGEGTKEKQQNKYVEELIKSAVEDTKKMNKNIKSTENISLPQLSNEQPKPELNHGGVEVEEKDTLQTYEATFNAMENYIHNKESQQPSVVMVETMLDKVFNIIKEKNPITLTDLSSELKITKWRALHFGKVLQEQNIVKIKQINEEELELALK